MNHRIRLAFLTMLVYVTFSLPLKTGARSMPGCISWSPDGNKLAIVDNIGALHLWNAFTLQPIRDIQSPVGAIDTITWNPEGTRLATNTSIQNDGIRIWDTTTGLLIAHLPESADPVSGKGMVAWSPDGTKIASAQFPGNADTIPIHIWNASQDKYQLLATVENGPQQVSGIAWSADSRQLAVSAYTGLFIFSQLSTALPTVRRIPLPYGLFTAAWRPDGTELAIASVEPSGAGLDGKVHIWDLLTSRDVLVLPSGPTLTFAWSQQGNRLASGGQNINVWDTTTGQLLERFLITSDSIVWSPFGSRLAYLGKLSPSAGSRTQTIQSDVAQIVVPAPSTGTLQDLVKQCTDADVRSQLIEQIKARNLTAFAKHINQLSGDRIAPACAADLVAIANALQQK